MNWTTSPLRVLDFDIETRRIGFHTGGPFNPDGCEPVAIACSWVGQRRIEYWLRGDDPAPMLWRFRARYEEADIVTGHYIRKFDLPILNGAMFEHGLPLLGPKLTCDTKTDLVRLAGMSLSQENLAAMRELHYSKFPMNDYWWRRVARLDKEAVRMARTRVVADVRQHKELRASLLDAGALRAPRMWRP